MSPILHEWGGFLIRWTHVVAAMAWIGASFYFMHLDASLRAIPAIPAGKGGEAWEVHGGGFYRVRKYMVAPERMPDHLIWHKWQSYGTWISGFSLLCWVYYGQADLYLIDPAVRAITPATGAALGLGGLGLGWLAYDGLNRSPLAHRPPLLVAAVFLTVLAFAYAFQQVFSGRAAMLHTGAVIATWMTGNVFFVIMPNQRKAIAELVAGRVPDPAWGRQAKNRSAHNNALTLPVLFFMLSGHHPMAWSSSYGWVIVGLVVIAGGVVRHFFNVRNAGGGDRWWTWAVAAACMVLAVAVSVASSPATGEGLAEAPGAAPSRRASVEAGAMAVIETRCAMCHAARPLWPDLASAPKGVRLDTPAQVARHAPAIRVQAVLTHAMPPNNITDMQPGERDTLARWLAGRRDAGTGP